MSYSEPVKCRACAASTRFDLDDFNRLKAQERIYDGGYRSGARLLSWECDACRAIDRAAIPPLELQMARIREGVARLRKAGKPLGAAIDRAVNSQMDEDERRRFPAFYHWRRETPGQEPQREPDAWKPPPTFGQPLEATPWA